MSYYHYIDDETILPKTNYNSPFYSSVPLHSQPTDILSKRFELWRQIIKSLINYFKSIAIANQQYSKINDNLIQTINFPFFTNIFPKVGGVAMENNKIFEPRVEDLKKQTYFASFGNGSIQDIQILLKKYHLNLGQQQRTISIELINTLVPRLEELQKDLFIKIREIKNLNSDFKNSLNQEIAITGQCLNDYIDVVKMYKNGVIESGSGKKDPYLLRLKLEIQLKQQLYQENYLEEAFINLQITGLELEKIIFQEMQNSLNRYNELISQEIFVMYNDLINELHQGIISKKNFFEWDESIKKDSSAEFKKHFLTILHDDQLPIPRKLSSIKYPYNKSIISKCFRSGYLLKKSKLLKNYSKSFFILTINYLHEFKSSNLMETPTPINSINLNDAILTESNDMKFQLHVKHIIGPDNKIKTHNYVFKRCLNEMDEYQFKKWIIDLKNMTSFNSFNERFKYINGKLSNSNSRSNTPMFEISNPMDNIDKVNEKLQNLQITSITNEANEGREGEEQQEQEQEPEPQAPSPSQLSPSPNEQQDITQNFTQFAQNIKPTLPKLSLSSLPKVQIQEPSPIHPSTTSNTNSSEDLIKLAIQHNQQAPRPASITSSTNTSSLGSSSISAIGVPTLTKQKSHIDLNGSLYKDEDKKEEDDELNKVLDALKNEV